MHPRDKKHHSGDIPHDSPANEMDEYDDGVEVIRPRPAYRPELHASHDHVVMEDEEEGLPPSKTRIKKQMHELRDLGKELTELGKDQLDQLDLPDALREAIAELKGINKFGAQRRQIQYIGKLMREVDPAPIQEKLDGWKGKSQQHVAYTHLLERWRDRLLENDDALTELLAAYPDADVQHLRNLMRNARKEPLAGKPPKAYRELYQVLKAIIPESR